MSRGVAPAVQAERLTRFLVRHHAAVSPYGWRRLTADEIAERFLADVTFAELGLADWLRSPDGILIREVVADTLPPWQAVEVELLVQAILLAANRQRREEQITLATMVGLAPAVALAAVVLARFIRVDRR